MELRFINIKRNTPKKRRKKKARRKIDWVVATDIKAEIDNLVHLVEMDWIDTTKIHCVRSQNANTRAYARIWGLSRIWQQTLGISPSYVIEVISEKFDKLDDSSRAEVLLHELAHIPKNFSGSLVPHTRHGAGSFHDKLHQFITAYKRTR